MTVDLEDYFCDLEFSEWDKYESRIVQTTKPLLDLFERYNVKATFFTVGHIAEKFPELIDQIVKMGHEIASHSYSHLDIRKSTPEQFEKDLVKSIETLEKISGEKVYGFRAPYFSVNSDTFWVFNIFRKYLKYDSSVFPVKTPLYGLPNAPRNIYRPSRSNPLIDEGNGDLIEIPPATLHLPLFGNLPIAGGFYIRFLPYWLIHYGINKINKSGNIAMCYIHPKDLDTNMPKIADYKWHYYYGLKNSLKKYENLLRNFKFDSVRNVLEL